MTMENIQAVDNSLIFFTHKNYRQSHNNPTYNVSGIFVLADLLSAILTRQQKCRRSLMKQQLMCQHRDVPERPKKNEYIFWRHGPENARA
jgi:hypothetical protein